MAYHDFSSFIQEIENGPTKSEPRRKENTYFLLDLKLPKVRELFNDSDNFKHDSPPQKYGILEMLESIHGIDLRANNPWVNRCIAEARYRKALKACKLVRFTTHETETTELPYCRHRDTTEYRKEHHNPCCRNSRFFSSAPKHLRFENLPKTRSKCI